MCVCGAGIIKDWSDQLHSLPSAYTRTWSELCLIVASDLCSEILPPWYPRRGQIFLWQYGWEEGRTKTFPPNWVPAHDPRASPPLASFPASRSNQLILSKNFFPWLTAEHSSQGLSSPMAFLQERRFNLYFFAILPWTRSFVNFPRSPAVSEGAKVQALIFFTPILVIIAPKLCSGFAERWLGQIIHSTKKLFHSKCFPLTKTWAP